MNDTEQLDKDVYKYGFSYKDTSILKSPKGLNEEVIRQMSYAKNEPQWMLDYRIESYHEFLKKPMPLWGADISDIDFDELCYYAKPIEQKAKTWDDLPAEIKETYDRLGIPEAEQRILAGIDKGNPQHVLGGVGAQYDSEVVYHSLLDEFIQQGVIFCSPEEALIKYPQLFKKYFGTIVNNRDNKFASLNSAVWSGGSFVYVPKGVQVHIPLQAYFRINSATFGQFERTLIIADEGSFVHYVEGCTAPVYSENSLHSAVVEIVALPESRVRYSTVQNWSNNVYNLVTKRAVAYKNATMEWVDGNIGSKRTMKYPSVYLMEEGAHGEVLSIAFASQGQEQDTGAKMFHHAKNTSSLITSKSISKDGGIASYRGHIFVDENLTDVRCNVECDALILDKDSGTNTYPYMDIKSKDVAIQHEARVSRINEEQIFYLQSRGLEEAEAVAMVINGFIDPLIKQLPLEYAIELNKLIELEMEGSVG